MAEICIEVNDSNLTENYNIWSEEAYETVLASSAPLVMWFLQSWWRLLYEPFQAYKYDTNGLSTAWRMAHELGAANHGFVWPKIAFVSDLSHIHIFARASDDKKQSVRYINGISTPQAITLSSFENALDAYISQTIDRLNSLGANGSSVKELWEIIKEEREDLSMSAYRRIEAIMGYDPDDASDVIMEYALEKYDKIGHSSLEELAICYGKYSEGSINDIEDFVKHSGVLGKPDIKLLQKVNSINIESPWKQAIHDAQYIRKEINNINKPIETTRLLDILGVATSSQEKWGVTIDKHNASVGIREESGSIKYLPRKKHPLGKRFEQARYLGDFITMPHEQWLVSTDMRTARQKYQRAFAAEFLCPFDGLMEYIQDDFSDDRRKEAADYFQVSEQIITSTLANNGELDQHYNTESYHQYFH